MLLADRSDRKKNPTMREYRELSPDEIMNLSSGKHIQIVDLQGRVTNCKITSIKRWKRRPDDLEINVKWGLYDYFTIRMIDKSISPDRIVTPVESSGKD